MNYLKSILLIIIVSLFGGMLQHSIVQANLVMLYILVVVITALKWGRGPSFFSAILCVLVFDFFFVSPRFSMTVADTQYLIVFITLFVVGMVISNLVLKSKEQAEVAKKLFEEAQQANALREAEKLHTAFLNSVSHDLKTPLSSILGSLSSILNSIDMDTKSKQSLIETAYEESSRMNQLVGDLLDMARVEAGALKISVSPVEIRDLIGTVLKQMEAVLKDFKVTVEIPDNLPEISVDFPLIIKVLRNILDNAIKYSQSIKEIKIDVRLKEGFIEIKIYDYGIGIPTSDLKHVFDKFYRVKRPKNYEGTGLGLSVCKGIVEAHKGKIWADNFQGGGTVITITLSLL
ncbi:MAG: DUF4118 domain-containing protein [Elusimicrobia bacterium]|nr:DUF4118 domain-containing protein [Elusimicrobiota bacterium]